MPQLHHNMDVLGVEHAVLSIFKGTQVYEFFDVARDDDYALEVYQRELTFWQCVQNRVPPPSMAAVEPPAPPSEFIPYDMTGNNQWASEAFAWLLARDAYEQFKASDKALRKLVPTNASIAYGHGLEAKRGKDGKLRLTESKK